MYISSKGTHHVLSNLCYIITPGTLSRQPLFGLLLLVHIYMRFPFQFQHIPDVPNNPHRHKQLCKASLRHWSFRSALPTCLNSRDSRLDDLVTFHTFSPDHLVLHVDISLVTNHHTRSQLDALHSVYLMV